MADLSSSAATVDAPSAAPSTAGGVTQEPATERRKRVLSGVQPTGSLHLGNYLGAIRNWVNLQDIYGENMDIIVCLSAAWCPNGRIWGAPLCRGEQPMSMQTFLITRSLISKPTSSPPAVSIAIADLIFFPPFLHSDTYFMVVDMHAITLPHEPKELLLSTRSSAALYLACGIDPSRARVFVQSHVPAHAELAWMLTCIAPVGWLRKMIQFKEKSRKAGNEEVGTGLLTYPVLMAADILLYQSDLVPVGDDQRQHLELARDLAERANYLFGGKKAKKMGCKYTRLFKVPEAFIPPAGARVMSLQDGASKMSKSAESDLSRINLLDSPDEIVNKIKRAKTDPFEGLEWDNPDRPEARNLLTIYQCVTGLPKEAVEAEVASLRWGEFKPRLADAVVAHLEPIQQRYTEVMQDTALLDKVLAEGAEAASKEANSTLDNVRQAFGFTPKL